MRSLWYSDIRNLKMTVMKSLLKMVVRMVIGIVLGLVYGWFVLSFAWSFDDMSVAEKIAGVVYGFCMMPLYECITRALRLQ